MILCSAKCSKSGFEKSVIIENSSFSASDSSTIWISVTFDGIFSVGNTNRIIVESTTFSGAFQMLRIEGTPLCEVTINDVNVSYSQFLNYPPALDIDSVITIDSESTLLAMNDVIVMAAVECGSSEIFGNNMIAESILPYCNPPVPFLINKVCWNMLRSMCPLHRVHILFSFFSYLMYLLMTSGYRKFEQCPIAWNVQCLLLHRGTRSSGDSSHDGMVQIPKCRYLFHAIPVL